MEIFEKHCKSCGMHPSKFLEAANETESFKNYDKIDF